MHTRDDFLARIVDAASRINNRGDHIRRTADDLHTGDTMFFKVNTRYLNIHCEVQKFCQFSVSNLLFKH